MSIFRSRRAVAVIAALLLLALFVIRPGAGGLKTRIARSISLALARQVEIGSVRVRLLPQPGFDLNNFVVHDDPLVSAEPMLRAQEVTAVLRLTSLLRGRIEISRLSLSEPSLNLMRNEDGRWNLENLLARSAAITVAPTGKARSEHRPAFPYIEADRGRINFKIGPEKRPYSLTEADFALWQDSENAWAVRLKARPVRTDFNLSDTGLLRVEGSWQRATTLRQTPLQFNVRWERAQLGQLTKLLTGTDKGWRGGVTANLVLSGSPQDLSIMATSAIQDFHRYDIIHNNALTLNAHCVAHYQYSDRTLSNIICGAPVGDGTVALRGNVAGVLAPYDYDLSLSAEQVPMQEFVRLASHIKKDLPDDLSAQGTLDAQFSLRRSTGNSVQLTGSGHTNDFQLSSAVNKTELALGTLPFSIRIETETRNDVKKTKKTTSARSTETGNQLLVGPFNFALGRPTPATVSGQFSRAGYSITVQGDSQLKRLLQVARIAGLPAAQLNADGLAKLDLQIAGQWDGFPPPNVVGTAVLRDVHAAVRGLHAPFAITSADVVLEDQNVKFQRIVATVADSRWSGSVSLPRHCTSLTACPMIADLHTEEINLRKLNDLFHPHLPEQPWYKFFSNASPQGSSVFTSIQASGTIVANRIVVGDLAGNNVSATFELLDGKLRVPDLRAVLLGGKYVGSWKADFSAKPPVYSGGGTLERTSLAQLANAMNDPWITGTGNAICHLNTSGYTAAELLAAGEATVQFEMRDGTLPHISLMPGGGALHVRRFKGRMNWHEGQMQIEPSTLEASGGIYEISGTASSSRALDIRMARDSAHTFNITGTLDDPHVVATGRETQAALKP